MLSLSLICAPTAHSQLDTHINATHTHTHAYTTTYRKHKTDNFILTNVSAVKFIKITWKSCWVYLVIESYFIKFSGKHFHWYFKSVNTLTLVFLFIYLFLPDRTFLLLMRFAFQPTTDFHIKRLMLHQMLKTAYGWENVFSSLTL